MRLLFTADGRSPIALNWISYFVQAGYEVHLVSTYPCETELNVSSIHILPVAMSSVERKDVSTSSQTGMLRRWIPVRVRTIVRQWLGPLTLPGAARRLREIIASLQPDLVHAMRIPYEGMLAALALTDMRDTPLLLSVWGNDFTLHAGSTPWMSRYTRLALQRADALHADCARDIRLAQEWGFSGDKPTALLPGGGGIQLDLFYPLGKSSEALTEPVYVINPRGFRAYVRNDTFFKAIPLIQERDARIHFICPSMADEPQAWRWLEELGISSGVELLPAQSRAAMADLFRKAHIAVSPSEHDGTPNTLLEAMACGCFPIAGDIESLREWIVPGVNGTLVDPADPAGLAQAVLSAASQPHLREAAREYNTRLVAERAEYRRVMSRAEQYYQQLANAPG